MSVCQLRGKIVPSKVEVYQLREKMVTQDGTLTHSVLSEQKNSHTYTSFQKVWLNHNQYHFNWAHFGNTELFILLLRESMHYCHFNSSKEPPLPTFSTQNTTETTVHKIVVSHLPIAHERKFYASSWKPNHIAYTPKKFFLQHYHAFFDLIILLFLLKHNTNQDYPWRKSLHEALYAIPWHIECKGHLKSKTLENRKTC